MSLLNFKYCPFCGGDLPQDKIIKFCPFCGEKFLLNENTMQESQHDKIIKKSNHLPLPQDVIDTEKHTEINLDEYNKINIGKIIESEFYSIILKHASNKESLVRRLEKVLLRGSFAIQLAVDNIPTIIIYKARGNDIRYYNEIFREEQASVSIVPGDYIKPTVEQLFSPFDKLSIQTQQVIGQLPINLWIGDKVCGIFPNTSQKTNEGITVITDKNIFFLPIHTSAVDYQWFVRSYGLISKIVLEDNSLHLIYKGNRLTNIRFSDIEQLVTAYRCIDHMVQS